MGQKEEGEREERGSGRGIGNLYRERVKMRQPRRRRLIGG
jgi:hypothetical protein